MQYDVAIIGAGVIGGMLARTLSRYELKVCLLEKENDVAMGASKANSGIIHGGYDPVPGTLKAKLNVSGVEPLFEVAEQLQVSYRRNGSMVCAFSEEEENVLSELFAQGIENGVIGMEIISGDEARALEPYLSGDVRKVLRIPNAGIISPYELTVAAVGNAMDNGAELRRNFEVMSISHNGTGFLVASKSGEEIQAKYLVNCAGGYSGKIALMTGDDAFTLLPRAGEYLLLDKGEGFRASHTLFQCPTSNGKGILVTPTIHGNLLVGPNATAVQSPEDRDTTPEGLSQVSELAVKTVPTINFRQVITSFTGVRASEKKGDFIIKASSKIPGLIHAGAIDSPGLTCCVSIAQYLTDLLQKQGLRLVKKDSWDGTRVSPCAFQKLSGDQKHQWIQNNPTFGKIICRCEGISEGEILQAIHQNPGARDLDGIKRRTRSGMGRCQGGFCGPYVMQLLSRELKIPMQQITKSGEGSEMLTGRIGEE